MHRRWCALSLMPPNIYLDNLPRLSVLRRSLPHDPVAGRPFPDIWQLRHETHAQHCSNYNLYRIAWQVGIKALDHGGLDVHARDPGQPGNACEIDDQGSRSEADGESGRFCSLRHRKSGQILYQEASDERSYHVADQITAGRSCNHRWTSRVIGEHRDAGDSHQQIDDLAERTQPFAENSAGQQHEKIGENYGNGAE